MMTHLPSNTEIDGKLEVKVDKGARRKFKLECHFFVSWILIGYVIQCYGFLVFLAQAYSVT